MVRKLAILGLAIGLAACGGSAPPPAPATPAAPTVAAAPAPEAPAAAGTLAWDYAFDDVKGWYDNDDDVSFRALITSNGDGTATIKEQGDDNWGKVALFIPDIDFSRGPVLEVTVKNVTNGAWGVGIVPDPWDDAQYKVLADRTEGAKTLTINLAEKTGWSGVKPVKLVLIALDEGATVVVDHVAIKYTK